ncbi:MAG: PAS domain-containing protein [gamma proteobacterium symbiont of Taylorina sp.]|nr:PAS domain-containing protein [gamma proteobacterium symbiont of Taylorina sp.]
MVVNALLETKPEHFSEYLSELSPSFTSHCSFSSDDTAPLQESITETRLRTLLKALPAGIVVLDGEGIVQECNPAAIELLDEPLLGLPWRMVIDRAFDHQRISGQDSITKKGQIVSISTCPLGEGVPGQIVLLQDVTEKHQLQAKYDQQKRLASMGQMAAQLAHQIRTPISAALLYASHLKSPNLDNDKRLRFADKILTRIQSLEQLINDMLLFSRNGMENRESISVQQLLNELKQSVAASMPHERSEYQQIDVNFNYMPDKTHYISGNRSLLISGLVNLVNNAIHAIPGDKAGKKHYEGNIRVEVSQPLEGAVDFIIEDNGSGIAEENLNKIFQPFYTTKNNGTGLGLAVVKAISNAHDGDLWLEKTSARGTLFRMRLPTQIQSIRTKSELSRSR